MDGKQREFWRPADPELIHETVYECMGVAELRGSALKSEVFRDQD